MAVLAVAEGDKSCPFNHSPIKGIGDTRAGPRLAGSHAAVSLNAGILAHLSEFVTREIPRICRGFFLVDRADQTEEIPCLTAYWMSWALVFTFSCSMIRDLWYSIVLGVR